MQYILISVILFVLELLYFKIADKYNIIDKPNLRSSHTEVTLRGGGIIFWLAALMFLCQDFFLVAWFFLGISIVSLVSFWDDIQGLSNRIRLMAHFAVISLIYYNLNLFSIPLWAIIASYIFLTGIINAYNFMDGINGITGVYTLAVFGAFGYYNYFVSEFININFIIYPILASLVFLFFNFRKKAKCFAGDIGSIAIAFWIIYVLLHLIIKTNSLVWVLFLAVYIVDSIATVGHRVILKQNIFEAHRLHFYQILSNEYKIQHRLVSVGYGVLQALISVFIIKFYNIIDDKYIFIIVLLPLLLLYSIKFYLIKNIKQL